MKRVLLFAMVLMLAATAFAAQPVSSTGTPVVTPAKSAGHQVIPVTPKAITWTTIDSITPAGSRVSAAALNGKIYRIGGQIPGVAGLRTVQVFDPAVGTWSAGTPLPRTNSNTGTATWRNQIYVVGGSDSAGVVLDSLMVFNADSNAWHMEPPMPAALWGVGCAVLADTLYVCGGINGAVVNTVYGYDLVNHTWTTKATLPVALRSPACAVMNGRLYCIGGFTTTDVNTVYVYDPYIDLWTTKTPMTANRSGHAAMTIGSRVYVMDGGWYSFLNTTEYYEPSADTAGGTPWTSEASNTFGRRALGFAALGNAAYLVGGYNNYYRACVEKGVTDAPVVQDVEMQRIQVMPYVGNYGALVHPSIGVANNTPFWQYNTPLTLRIDSAGFTVYQQTIFKNLGPISGYGIPLPAWRPCTTPGIVYDLTAYNSLTSDQDQSNDTVRTTVTVKDAVWFQYDSTSSAAHPAQNFEPGYDIYDCWIADDFSIDGVDTVRIDSIAIKGMYSGGGGPADSLSLIITSDSSWYPAFSQTVAGAMVLPANFSDNAGTFMARLNPPFKLPAAERYWLVGQTCLNYGTGGQWFWNNCAGVLNYATTTAYFINPGDGFSTGATNWTPVSAIWSGTYNYSFVLYGGQYLGVAGNPVTSQPRPDFRLAQVSPNPMRDNARFLFSLAKGSHAKLDVYSLTGQKVASLVDGYRAGGRHEVSWNGRDQSGRQTASGMYFYRLTADGRALTRKFVVVK